MTEDEARKKWCPFIRLTPVDGDGSRNRPWHGNEMYCIASDCMAWRWDGGAYWDGDTSGRTPEETGAKTVRDGYCGLAGKP